MRRSSRQSSRASLMAALGLSAVPIVGLTMQYTGDSSPTVAVQSQIVGVSSASSLPIDVGVSKEGRSSGGFAQTMNAADTTADAAVARAAAKAAQAFAEAGPTVVEIVPVATSEATSGAGG